MTESLLIKKHSKLIAKCLQILPSAYAGFQNSRPTILYFLTSSLDLLNILDNMLSETDKKKYIDWIYNLQINSSTDLLGNCCGFQGSLFFNEEKNINCLKYKSAHIAQTYTALCSLIILGDNLSRVDILAVLKGVQLCQKDDGSFCAFGSKSSESDMRFVFCAVAICFILNNFSYINLDKIKNFIVKSVNYDGGIGQAPYCESHGGSTYCAIATLYMLGVLWDYSVLNRHQIEKLKNWAILKQNEGFHGRTNKTDDSCYAFWIGGTLSMLNFVQCVDENSVRDFLMKTQDDIIGGFSKYKNSTSDILHTYFCIAALSIFNEPFINPVFVPLNISLKAYHRLKKLQKDFKI